MPWVLKDELVKRVVKKLLDETSHFTPASLNEIIEMYPRRVRKTCDCDSEKMCECIVFGLYDDYIIAYECFIA